MSYQKYRNFSKKEFLSEKKFEDSGTPTKTISKDSEMIQVKAFKDLKFGQTVSIKVDPTTQATTMSQPYAIIAQTNKVIDGVYPGEHNLAGIILEQLMNSNSSKLVHNFDSGTLKLKMNYLFLSIDDPNRTALNEEMGSAINEALATVDAEMMTQLPFTQWNIEAVSTNSKSTKNFTRLVDKEVEVKNEDGTVSKTTQVESENIPDDELNESQKILKAKAESKAVKQMPNMDSTNRGLALVFYQSILQNIAGVLAKYNQLRSLETHLVDMGFRREAPLTHKLFGLLKKKSFIAILNSLSNYLVGEYFDRDWFSQMNNLTIVPSRKAMCVRHPLLSIKATHKIPNIKVTFGTSKTDLFQTSDYKTQINGKDVTISEIFENLISSLDQSSVLTWARQFYSNISQVSVQSYFNNIITNLTALDTIMARFSGDMNDLRSYLDVTQRTNLNYWKKGTTFDVEAISQITPSFNQICHNVFVSYLSSPEFITWDDSIQRWKFHVVWNEFTGIPEYDKMTGGSFLTFSVRTEQLPSGANPGDARFLTPKLFDIEENSVTLLARSGLVVPIQYKIKTANEIKENSILSRLIPFNSMDVTMRMPWGDITKSATNKGAASALYDAIETTFGFGEVVVNSATTDISLNRDYVCFLDVQMGDVANAMISYARTYAPFRVWTKSGARSMGFGRSH